MGYDLHITRAESWVQNEGYEITVDEWLRYVQSDPELRLIPERGNYFVQWNGLCKYPDPWFDWFDGNIYTKNPDKEIIKKMLQIAKTLQARVQGDDGEFYDEREEALPQQTTLSLRERIARWFNSLRPAKPLEMDHPKLPFGVGDRVCDVWGNEHTVIEIDPIANHGTGLIRTRRNDGTILGHSMIAYDLKPIVNKEAD